MIRLSFPIVLVASAYSLKSCTALLLPLMSTVTVLDQQSRRQAVLGSAVAVVGASSWLSNTPPANAADSTSSADTAAMDTVNDLLGRLKGIPTFCIVSPEGSAYMVFKNDQAMAIGYAFITFQGALAVLGDAQRNAEQKGYADVWKDATITTIPLDIAIRLALKKRKRKSQKDQTLDTLLNIIPGADDRQDGIAIDSRFKDQGRVPLFYLSELIADDGALSVYFSRKDLVSEWNQQNPGMPLPSVKAIDLVGIFENTLRGRDSYMPSKNLSFVPTEEALKVAKEMKSRGLAPYNPNRMII